VADGTVKEKERPALIQTWCGAEGHGAHQELPAVQALQQDRRDQGSLPCLGVRWRHRILAGSAAASEGDPLPAVGEGLLGSPKMQIAGDQDRQQVVAKGWPRVLSRRIFQV
jgi:hypothetical protein